VGVEPALAHGRAELVGVTRAAGLAPGFLVAAAYGDPARVLARAALRGEGDPLAGLHENAMLGRLIPAGTGFCAPPGRDV
jgi:DNA-directed RNA polymerase subunit beta'